MHIYTKEFFKDQQEGSYTSAKELLPIIFTLLHPTSVVDVGCGVGTWLKVCQEAGIDDVVGVDGPYVSKELLQIPVSKFQEADLSVPLHSSRKFDLVMSLEVAEHLPPASAKTFVTSLTNLSPVVLFSAAIPFQGGHNHTNEQWQSYWADLFLEQGYVAIDYIRPAIWNTQRVEWWYAQNCLLLAQKEYAKTNEHLQRLAQNTDTAQLNIVHPKNYIRFAQGQQASLGSVLGFLKRNLLHLFSK